MNSYSIVKAYFDKTKLNFVCLYYPKTGGYESHRFDRVRGLFDHLAQNYDNPEIKLIFETPYLSPDFRFYLRLTKKKQHHEKQLNAMKTSLGGFSNVIDNRWDAYQKDPSLHSTERRDRSEKRRLSISDSFVGE